LTPHQGLQKLAHPAETIFHQSMKTFPQNCAKELSLKRENATRLVAFPFSIG
jgi:hypothetical protein